MKETINELTERALATQIQEPREPPTKEVIRFRHVLSKAKNLLFAMDLQEKGIGTVNRVNIAREDLKKACDGL
jgi:hypothetical protein